MIRRCLPVVLLFGLAGPVLSGDPPFQRAGGLLVDRAGMAVYTFDEDALPGVSSCYGPCAALWPPVYADADATARGDYSLATRKDGRKQWAWRNKPLYYWVSDRRQGDASGEAVTGWHLVR